MVRRTLRDRHRLHALALARTLFAGADAGVQPRRRIGIRPAGSSLRPPPSHGAGKTKLRTAMERPYKVYEFAFNALNFFRPFLASATVSYTHLTLPTIA